MQNAVVVDRATERDGYSESRPREQQSVPAQREPTAARPPHFIGEEARKGEPTRHASHREQSEDRNGLSIKNGRTNLSEPPNAAQY